jgi:hypothetical protein
VIVEKTAELESREPALAQAARRDVKARTLLMFGDDDLLTIKHMRGEPRRRAGDHPGDLSFPAGPIGRALRDLLLPVFLRQGVKTFEPIYAHHIEWQA